ncbi:hypothetical protein CICLE_v10010539mg, partial [Citrus x clementina]
FFHTQKYNSGCYIFFTSSGCRSAFSEAAAPVIMRENKQMAYRLVIKETSNPVQSKNPKIASMFLTQGSLPFELLWDKFSIFSVYVHALRDKPVHLSRYFIDRDICSDQVIWGRISMVNAERRLLANALKDPDNQHFVLLSDSCVPLHIFDYVYNYLMYSNVSFVDCYKYPGLHGNGRYSESMLPEAELKDLRKGVQLKFLAYGYIVKLLGGAKPWGECQSLGRCQIMKNPPKLKSK